LPSALDPHAWFGHYVGTESSEIHPSAREPVRVELGDDLALGDLELEHEPDSLGCSAA
jgi:hypothetical protein